MKKTQIIKLTESFTFLQTRYRITKAGKIIWKIPRVTIKMKKLTRLVIANKITFQEFVSQYKSWHSNKGKSTLCNMDKKMEELTEWIRKFIPSI